MCKETISLTDMIDIILIFLSTRMKDSPDSYLQSWDAHMRKKSNLKKLPPYMIPPQIN